MRNLKILQNSTRRNILKVIGVSLIGSSSLALYNFRKKNLKRKSKMMILGIDDQGLKCMILVYTIKMYSKLLGSQN